jgi:hypothetical protein
MPSDAHMHSKDPHRVRQNLFCQPKKTKQQRGKRGLLTRNGGILSGYTSTMMHQPSIFLLLLQMQISESLSLFFWSQIISHISSDVGVVYGRTATRPNHSLIPCFCSACWRTFLDTKDGPLECRTKWNRRGAELTFDNLPPTLRCWLSAQRTSTQ